MDHQFVLLKPLVTEKTLAGQKLNRYGFQVANGSTKNQIKIAVEQAFAVNVTAVRTVTINSTSKRTGRKRLPGKTKVVKKAYVTIKAGQTLKVFEAKG